MKTLWLIQRGTIQTERTESIEKIGIDDLVSWDYMGSAEYEFGALGQSLKRIRKNISQYVSFVFILNEKEITTFFKECDKDFVLDAIQKLSNNPPRLKEIAEFDKFCGNAQPSYYSKITRVNFWWDIENDFMFWSSTIEFTNKFITAIKQKKEV